VKQRIRAGDFRQLGLNAPQFARVWTVIEHQRVPAERAGDMTTERDYRDEGAAEAAAMAIRARGGRASVVVRDGGAA